MINLRSIFSFKVIVVLITAIVLGSLFAVYLVNRNRQSVMNNIDQTETIATVQEIEGAPKNYYLSCQLKKLVTKEVEVKTIQGQLFGICEYPAEGEAQQIAVMLAFIDRTKGITFMSGDKFGIANAIYEPSAFEPMAEQAGFSVGDNLALVLTAVTNPEGDLGLSGLKRVGEYISQLYEEQGSFDTFSQTSKAADLPQIGEVDGAPIVLPVSVR